MQFQMPPNQPNPMRHYRGIFNGFLAGLLVGALLGWFFHGVVSFFVQFGLVLLLLIPLILIGLFLWRSRRAGTRAGPGAGDRGGMRVYTWGGDRRADGPFGSGPRRSGGPGVRRPDAERESDSSSQRDRQEIIDLEFEEIKRDTDGEKSS